LTRIIDYAVGTVDYTNSTVPNYTVLATALAAAKARAGITGTTNDAEFTELLQLTAGETPTNAMPPRTRLYRPFLVAAYWLEQKQTTLRAAKGAEFRRWGAEARAHRGAQQAIDVRQNTLVPVGMGALEFGRGVGVGWGV
jgi:hypothetical protein